MKWSSRNSRRERVLGVVSGGFSLYIDGKRVLNRGGSKKLRLVSETRGPRLPEADEELGESLQPGLTRAESLGSSGQLSRW